MLREKNNGNRPLAVLTRLSAEVAYVQRRLCIRNAGDAVRASLERVAQELEKTIRHAEREENRISSQQQKE